MTELAIFDCDGGLVDSEPLACRSLEIALTNFGIEITYDEVAERFTGMGIKAVISDVKDRHGKDLTPAFWASVLMVLATV